MKKGGTGGNHTKDGLDYEEKVDILKKISKKCGYVVKGTDVWHKGILIARVLKKYEIYKQYLEPMGINWKECISKRLLPDNCVIIENQNRIVIVEVKYQTVGGSVDEKLQTCDFKKKEYEKLFKKLNKKIDFYYILSEYFKKNEEKYADVLRYMEETGCRYFYKIEDMLEELHLE